APGRSRDRRFPTRMRSMLLLVVPLQNLRNRFDWHAEVRSSKARPAVGGSQDGGIDSNDAVGGIKQRTARSALGRMSAMNYPSRQRVAHDPSGSERPDQASRCQAGRHVGDRSTMLAEDSPALSFVDPL